MDAKPFTPFHVLDIELSRPLAVLPRGGRALALVRLHTLPLGVVELDLEGGADPVEAISAALGEEIAEHLAADGLPSTASLALPLPAPTAPPCLDGRARLQDDAPFVSILVATHNRLDTLVPCLDSLLDQNYPVYEIIVVDNAPSGPATEEYVRARAAAEPRLRYVREDWPGLGSAHNRGLAETSAPFVAITDDDVIADPYWLVELMRGFHASERVGCVTGMIFPAEIETEAQYWLERSAGYAKGYRPRLFDLGRHRPAHPLFPYAAGMFGSGANMAFRTAALRALGGFDAGLGAGSVALGGDDLAAFFEVVSAGYTLVYQPSAVIRHRHHRQYAHLRKTAYGYGAGLTAYLAKTLIDRPARIFDLARRVPYGLYYALSPRSGKNARKAADTPPELAWIERRGMAAGPLLYLRSRRKTRSYPHPLQPPNGKNHKPPGGEKNQ